MTVADRSWRAGLWMLSATVAWTAAWYFGAVRGANEMALGFALMIGTGVALVGLVVTAVLIRDALVSGAARTPVRLTVASLVGVAIAGLIGFFFYIG